MISSTSPGSTSKAFSGFALGPDFGFSEQEVFCSTLNIETMVLSQWVLLKLFMMHLVRNPEVNLGPQDSPAVIWIRFFATYNHLGAGGASVWKASESLGKGSGCELWQPS